MDTLNLEGSELAAALGLTHSENADGAWRFSRALAHHEGGTLLSFSQRDGRQVIGLQVRLRDNDKPAWRRTPHLDCITHIPDDIDGRKACAWLGPLVDTLESLDGPLTQVVDTAPKGDPPPPVTRLELPSSLRPEAPSPFAFGKVFVLDLQSDCGQRCSFCSTRAKMSPQLSFTEAAFDRLVNGMRRGRTDGYTALRLSGLDPLTHPRVLDLMTEGAALGFGRIHLYTPGRRFADRSFREAFDALRHKSRITLHIPLYGEDAAGHDEVVGVEGAFSEVMAGLEGLAPFGEQELVLLTVATPQNLNALPGIRALAKRLGAPVQLFVPFPSTRDPDDAFFEVALRHEELIAAMMRCEPPMGLSELLPCVRYRHEITTGQPALTQGGFHDMNAALGTLFEHADYRRVDDEGGNTFTIPVTRCPHASSCALAPLCPRSVYTAYAETFGLSEMQPVTEDELAALSPALITLCRT